MNEQGFIFVVVVGTAFVLLLVGLVGVLMVVNTGRRHQHHAKMAEMQLRHARDLMKAEREAVRETLHDVGKELHDNVSQLLMVIHIGLNWSKQGEAPDPRLDPAREALAECINEVRSLGHALNLDLWKVNTLQDAIARMADRINRSGKWAVTVEAGPRPLILPPDTSAILFRVCQEVMTNAMKHSGARKITITLNASPPVITIADDGQGFAVGEVTAQAGLRNIVERTALVGFKARCTTAPGQGCTWVLAGAQEEDEAEEPPLPLLTRPADHGAAAPHGFGVSGQPARNRMW